MAKGQIHQCPECLRTFQSSRGLGVHRQWTHRDEYYREQQRNLRPVKVRWANEEMAIMARIECDLFLAGEDDINQLLAARLPNRTLEAIKGKRRQAAYRDMVQRLLREQEEEIPAAVGEDAGPIEPDPDPNPDPIIIVNAALMENRREEDVAEYVAELYVPFRPDYETRALRERFKSFGFILDPRMRERPMEIRHELIVDLALPNRVREKRMYAKLQELFSKDRAEALKCILGVDDYIERVIPSDLINEQWRAHIGLREIRPPVEDTNILAENQDREYLADCARDLTDVELEWALNSFWPGRLKGWTG